MKHNSTFVSTKTYQLEKTETLDLDEMPVGIDRTIVLQWTFPANVQK